MDARTALLTLTLLPILGAPPLRAQSGVRGEGRGGGARSMTGAAMEFDLADRRSRLLLRRNRCAGIASQAWAAGELGPHDGLPGASECTPIDGRMHLLLYWTDSAATRLVDVRALDLGTRRRVVIPIDSAARIAEARALLDAGRRASPAFDAARRRPTFLTIRTDGDSVEVWVLPITTMSGAAPTIGGERGYVYSPDGRTLAREIDAFDRLRAFALPTTLPITIESGEAEVPLVSELYAANGYAAEGYPVQLLTRLWSATLSAAGADGVWLFIRRGP